MTLTRMPVLRMRNISKKIMPAAKFEIKRKCQICGEEFLAKTIESWYCSPKCSKIAWKRRKDEEQRLQRLDEVVKKIPKFKEYITVPEAYALFGISKELFIV